jgi:hypothetical protein
MHLNNILHFGSLYHPNTVYKEFPVTNYICLVRDARPSHLLFWPLYRYLITCINREVPLYPSYPKCSRWDEFKIFSLCKLPLNCTIQILFSQI